MAVKVRLAKNTVFDAFRTQPDLQADVTRRLERIAAACGPGYVADVSTTSKNRARGTVYPDSAAARLDNARNLTLLKNLDAGRR